MPTYNVHLYREMRIEFRNVVANSPEEAASLCNGISETDLSVHRVKFCEGETHAALVDTIGAAGNAEFPDVLRETLIDFPAQKRLNLLPQMAELLAACREEMNPNSYSLHHDAEEALKKWEALRHE